MTNEEFEVYKTPEFPDPPQPPAKIYGMNLFALQMNAITDRLKSKLPPTDSRLRKDIRAWEEADMENAQA